MDRYYDEQENEITKNTFEQIQESNRTVFGNAFEEVYNTREGDEVHKIVNPKDVMITNNIGEHCGMYTKRHTPIGLTSHKLKLYNDLLIQVTTEQLLAMIQQGCREFCKREKCTMADILDRINGGN